MATKTWYLEQPSNGYLYFVEDSSAPASGVNYSNSGWNVGRNGSGNYALMSNGSEVSENSFSSGSPSSSTTTDTTTDTTYNNTYNDTSTTVVPVSGITLAYPYNAVFDDGNWLLDLDVQADNRSWSSGQGRIIGKMWYSVFNSNGTWTQTQIVNVGVGTGWVNGSSISGLSTSSSQTCSIDFDPGGVLPETITLAANKSSSTAGKNSCGYLTFELAWEITVDMSGGGRNRACDAMIMYGTNTSSTLTSPSFRKKIYATQ